MCRLCEPRQQNYECTSERRMYSYRRNTENMPQTYRYTHAHRLKRWQGQEIHAEIIFLSGYTKRSWEFTCKSQTIGPGHVSQGSKTFMLRTCGWSYCGQSSGKSILFIWPRWNKCGGVTASQNFKSSIHCCREGLRICRYPSNSHFIEMLANRRTFSLLSGYAIQRLLQGVRWTLDS